MDADLFFCGVLLLQGRVLAGFSKAIILAPEVYASPSLLFTDRWMVDPCLRKA